MEMTKENMELLGFSKEDIETVLEYNKSFPSLTSSIGCVIANELYEDLKVTQEFNEWMDEVIDCIMADKDEDYREFNGIYLLKEAMAKEIMMIAGFMENANEETRKLSIMVLNYFSIMHNHMMERLAKMEEESGRDWDEIN